MERSTLTIEEQETHINWNRGDARAKIYVSDVTTMTRLDKLVSAEGSEWKLDKEYREKDGRVSGKFYSCPVEFISFRTKRKEMTEEQKKEFAERMRALGVSIRTENNENLFQYTGEDEEENAEDV